jgi:hypothetical protein
MDCRLDPFSEGTNLDGAGGIVLTMLMPPRRRARALPLVGLSALLLCACPPRQSTPIEAPDPVATTAEPPTEPAAETDETQAVAEAELAPARPMFASDDGLVRAPLPADDAQWECVRQTSQPPKPPTTLIKCRQRESSRFFFLLAKDYEVTPEQRRDVDAIIAEVLPMTYERLFESFAITSTTPVVHQGSEGREVELRAVHSGLGDIRKREQIFVLGDHVMVLSAEGRPEMFDAVAGDIDAWFAGAEFANLGE